jgi:hypothetical protein
VFAENRGVDNAFASGGGSAGRLLILSIPARMKLVAELVGEGRIVLGRLRI